MKYNNDVHPECVSSSAPVADCSTMKCAAGYVCELVKYNNDVHPECVSSAAPVADCSTMKCAAGFVSEVQQ